jgi:DNA-binding PadR family transcriptional regulator
MARNGSDRGGFGVEIPPPARQVLQDERPDAPGTRPALGDVVYVVLGHVAASPQGIHGYRLGRMLARAPFRVPGLGASRLYRALRRLERAGLVRCQVESESARLRYRFAITPKGTAALTRWLTASPSEAGTLCQGVLNRLRFVGLLAPAARARLVDAAAEECAQALAALAAEGAAGNARGSCEVADAYVRALRARLVSDRGWIEEVRSLLARLAGAPAAAATGA